MVPFLTRIPNKSPKSTEFRQFEDEKTLPLAGITWKDRASNRYRPGSGLTVRE